MRIFRPTDTALWLLWGMLAGCAADPESSPRPGTGGAPAAPSGGSGGVSGMTSFGGSPAAGASQGGSTAAGAPQGGSTAAGAPGYGGNPAGAGASGSSGSAGLGAAANAGGSASGGAAGRGGSGGTAAAGTAGAGGATGGAAGAPATGGSGGSAGSLGNRCPATALFCEDFEDGNLDGWEKSSITGVLAVQTTLAASGKSALGIEIPPNQRGGFIEKRGAPLFPLPAKAMWGRMMVYFDGVSDGHTDFVRGATTSGGTPWYNVGEQHGEVMLNYYNGAAADCWARPSPTKVVAQKAWTCWEWRFDGNTNEMEFWIDGQPSRRVMGTGDGCLSNAKTTWAAPEFGRLSIGSYIAEPKATTMKMWIDDIAVGTQARIGCPAP